MHTNPGRRGTGIGNVPIADNNIYSSTGTMGGWFGGGTNQETNNNEEEDRDEDSPRARAPVRGVKNKIPRSWSQFWIKLFFGIEPPTNHPTVRRTWSEWWFNLIMRGVTYVLWSVIKAIIGSPFLGSFTFFLLVLGYFRWFRG